MVRQHDGAAGQKKVLLDKVKSILCYHQCLGIDCYGDSEHLQNFLGLEPHRATSDGGERSAKSQTRQTPQRTPAPSSSPASLAEISAEVTTCRACALHQSRLYPVPGRGQSGARLLIVGDWLSSGEETTLPPDHLFGVNEDTMLEKMLTAINLKAQDVFITNVIKCAVPGSCQPQAIHVEQCISYLRRQIASLRPEYICTMGIVAARAVLEKSHPLSILRSSLHQYQLDADVTIPVLVTYHPGYLLQNPEMKKATWSDLQLLAKKMGLQVRT